MFSYYVRLNVEYQLTHLFSQYEATPDARSRISDKKNLQTKVSVLQKLSYIRFSKFFRCSPPTLNSIGFSDVNFHKCQSLGQRLDVVVNAARETEMILENIRTWCVDMKIFSGKCQLLTSRTQKSTGGDPCVVTSARERVVRLPAWPAAVLPLRAA